jgi:Haem-NO-binding
LVAAATDVLGVSASDFLIGLGEHWVLKTGKGHYRPLLMSAGDNLKEFLLHLPQFYARVMLFYPKLQPPEFSCTDVGETSLRLHYFSHRPGLTDFVVGLVQGLGTLFETTAKATLVQSKAAGADHDIFEVTWISNDLQAAHGG